MRAMELGRELERGIELGLELERERVRESQREAKAVAAVKAREEAREREEVRMRATVAEGELRERAAKSTVGVLGSWSERKWQDASLVAARREQQEEADRNAREIWIHDKEAREKDRDVKTAKATSQGAKSAAEDNGRADAIGRMREQLEAAEQVSHA